MLQKDAAVTCNVKFNAVVITSELVMVIDVAAAGELVLLMLL